MILSGLTQCYIISEKRVIYENENPEICSLQNYVPNKIIRV